MDAGTSNNVYILTDDHSWVPAAVLELKEDEAVVAVGKYKSDDNIQTGIVSLQNKETITVDLKPYPNKTLPLQNVTEEGQLQEVEDMVDLPFLHEAAILYNLKARHAQGKPYTRTGDIVIAVNPYEWITDLYSESSRLAYSNALVWNPQTEGDARSSVEPHVYETSSLTYRGLAIDGVDQSILVSGESGAGKTETVKILMSHLASVQAGGVGGTEDESHVSPIVQRVLDSNPLLEAFGNAKTVRNDNSSRFGKYLQLQFDAEDPNHAAYAGRSVPSCVLAGSKCEVYLLEKSRVCGHEDDERTYHIFYQLLAASDDAKQQIWTGLIGTNNESFSYVGATDTGSIEGKTDGERFELTKQALGLIGVEGGSFIDLMRAMCIVLQLGNLRLDIDPEDEERSVIISTNELDELSELMGVDKDSISKALTERTMNARNETFTVPLKVDKATDSRDALAKEIYAKTFLWLVRNINDATCAEWNYDGDVKAGFGIIGLLDIFGFESFAVNRFEQLCINYANEKLQQKFTQDIFRSVQAEYEFEGIALGEIQYEDNADVLQLVEGRMGLIAVLNEECVRPKGSDTSFVNKIQAMNKDSEVLIVEKKFRDYEFGVQHYAGPVNYDATNFVTKNMDTLPVDLLECAKKCSNPIISNELENDKMMNDRGGAATKKKEPASARKSGTKLIHQTVWSKFRTQLTSLMALLGETRTRYIRCIKPNKLKQPRSMMHQSTVEQLRCAGVVAAVTISRSAFPNRLEHRVVLDRFKSLSPQSTDESPNASNGDSGKQVEVLLTATLKSLETMKEEKIVKAFVIGNTRAYFRAGALEVLEAMRLVGLTEWATHIQRIVRGFVSKSQYQRKRRSAIKAVASIRRFLQRRKYARTMLACIYLQCWLRSRLAVRELACRRRFRASTTIQSYWRCIVARKTFRQNRAAAVAIQAIARGAIQRPRFQKDLIEKREEAKLENQLKTLQRKLEEAERKRVEAEEKAANTKPTVVIRERDESEEKKEPSPAPAPSTVGQLTAQQQTLMDESGKMLEYLRKEVFKLRSQNAQLRTDFDLLKENNQRLMDANASAGASFAALNQHAKQLNKTNAKLTSEVVHYKQQIQKSSLAQVEVREELKMKQATYVAEVHSRLQYQKTLGKIVDVVQDRCRDTRVVEEVLKLSDECESTYMSGPTGLDQRSLFSSLTSPGANLLGNDEAGGTIVSKFKSFFS